MYQGIHKLQPGKLLQTKFQLRRAVILHQSICNELVTSPTKVLCKSKYFKSKQRQFLNNQTRLTNLTSRCWRELIRRAVILFKVFGMAWIRHLLIQARNQVIFVRQDFKSKVQRKTQNLDFFRISSKLLSKLGGIFSENAAAAASCI